MPALVPLTLVSVMAHIRHLQDVCWSHNLASLLRIEFIGATIIDHWDLSLRLSCICFILFLLIVFMLLTLHHYILILLELLINLVKLMRAETSAYLRVVLLINLHT